MPDAGAAPPHPAGTGITAPPPSEFDNGRSLSTAGIEALAIGAPLAAQPRFAYIATWYPDTSAGSPGHTLGLVRQDLQVSAPIYKGDHDVVTVSAGVRNEQIDTNVDLPVLGLPFPNDLWNVHFGLGYYHQFANCWTAGLNLHVGSASDDPFANINQITAGATASLRIPVREHDAWIFMLSYSNNTDFANKIPLPGVAYLWCPSTKFHALLGFPFARLWYQPVDRFLLDLSYRLPYTVQGQATYRFAPHWRAYAGYSMGDESYFLEQAPQDDDRLFYSEQRVYGGVGWAVDRRLSLDLSSGLAFNRFYAVGQNFRHADTLELPLGSGPYVSLIARWRF